MQFGIKLHNCVIPAHRVPKTSIYDTSSVCVLHLTGKPHSHSFNRRESEGCVGVSEPAFSFELTVKRSMYVFIANCK